MKKKKLPALTGLAVTLLRVAPVLEIAYMFYLVYKGIVGTDTLMSGGIYGYIMETMGFMTYACVSFSAMALIFAGLFADQARGKIGKSLFWMLVLFGWIVYDHKGALSQLIAFEGVTPEMIRTLGFEVAVPGAMLLALLTGNRVISVLAGICALGMAAFRVDAAAGLYTLVGTQTALVMSVCELLYGLGLFFGMLGIRKPRKDDAGKEEEKPNAAADSPETLPEAQGQTEDAGEQADLPACVKRLHEAGVIDDAERVQMMDRIGELEKKTQPEAQREEIPAAQADACAQGSVAIDRSAGGVNCPVCGANQYANRKNCIRCGVEFVDLTEKD